MSVELTGPEMSHHAAGAVRARQASSLLLNGGAPEIRVFGDASFADGMELGAWAFSVPDWRLEASGVCAGPTVEWFELAAAVAGLEHVVRVDRSFRPIRVYTDSIFAREMLELAAASNPLPGRKSAARVQDLYARAVTLGAGRKIKVKKANEGIAEHRLCDRTAKRALRGYVQTNPLFAARKLLQREQAALQALAARRGELETELLRVDLKMTEAQIRVDALRQYAACDG